MWNRKLISSAAAVGLLWLVFRRLKARQSERFVRSHASLCQRVDNLPEVNGATDHDDTPVVVVEASVNRMRRFYRARKADLMTWLREHAPVEFEHLFSGGSQTPAITKTEWQCMNAVKAEFGALSNTPANHMIVDEFVRKWYKKRGMRNSDIAMHAPRVTAFSFIPNQAEVDAQFILDGVTRYRARIGYKEPLA